MGSNPGSRDHKRGGLHHSPRSIITKDHPARYARCVTPALKCFSPVHQPWTWRTLLIVLALLPGVSHAMDDQAYQDLFYKKPPAPAFSRPADQREAQRQDAGYFDTYIDLDRSFSPAARQDAERRLHTLQAQAGTLSSAQFELAIAGITALAKNGHSQLLDIGLQADGQRYRQFPFFAPLFPEGPCVVSVMKEAEELLGSCITAIDGVPIRKVITTLRTFYGGHSEHFGTTTTYLDFLHHPDFLLAAGLIRNEEQVAITYRARDGHQQSTTVKAVSSEAAADRSHWTDLLRDDEPLPLSLRHRAQVFVRERISGTDGIYVQLRLNDDYHSQSIGEFLDATLDEVLETKPHFIVVDFRGNTGGDFTKTSAAMSQLPNVLPEGGRIYAITNGGTFSAAITSVNILKQVGGSRTVIVGESPGDGQRFWAEGDKLCLPNSGICAGYARGLHDYANGCEGKPACYESVVPAAVRLRVKSLKPDIAVDLTFADLSARRDAALDAILSAEAKRQQPER
jgi:hypothetical protein